MTILIYIFIASALACLIGAGLSRTNIRAKAAMALREKVIADYGLDDAYVSSDDDSFLGLAREGGVLVIGPMAAPRRIPFHAIRSVEGLRDGAVMVRAGREPAAAATPPIETDPLPPHTVRSLTLRITADGPDPAEHSVLFLDGGKHGLEPHNSHLRRQAALTEAWYRRLVEAMRTHGI